MKDLTIKRPHVVNASTISAASRPTKNRAAPRVGSARAFANRNR